MTYVVFKGFFKKITKQENKIEIILGVGTKVTFLITLRFLLEPPVFVWF